MPGDAERGEDWETIEYGTCPTCGYVMLPERSVDIDTRLDLLLARALVAETSQTKRRKS